MLFNSMFFQLDRNPLSKTRPLTHHCIRNTIHKNTKSDDQKPNSRADLCNYRVTAGQTGFQSVDRCQNVRSVSVQSQKWEYISGFRVHIHQLHAPDKDSALL